MALNQYGQLRMAIIKAHPGVDLDLIDFYISNRYADIILNGLSWKRLETQSVIQVPPSYNVGSLTATQGSPNVVGLGTTWTSQMNGLLIRINNQTEYYQFTQASATTGTLDRPYEGSTLSILTSSVGAGGAGYLVGDQVWVIGGNNLAQIVIQTVGSGGAVLTYSIERTGNGYAVANGVSTTGGTGTGFTLNILTVGGSAGLPYRIDQNIFVLPSNCRVVRGVTPMHDRLSQLNRLSPNQLNYERPTRLVYGTPCNWVQTWDSQNDPPQMQLELDPIPASPDSQGALLSFVVDYIFDPAPINPANTSATLLPWQSPTALFEGVSADIQLHQKENVAMSDAHEAKFNRAVKNMANVNAQLRGPTRIRIADEYLGNTHRGHRRGPRHSGFTG